MEKKVFVTYSWDDEEHKTWVKEFVDKLINNQIDVFFDQYDVKPGDSFTNFMEKSINHSDKVLVILTPNYNSKSINRKGGVGYEQQIISGEIFNGIQRNKFIPILRKGDFDGENCSIPPHFKGISLLDFRNNNSEGEFEDLLRAIFEIPKNLKPKLGELPNFVNKEEKKFDIKLDAKFNFKISDLALQNLLLDLSDCIKNNIKFKIYFDIDDLSSRVSKYTKLQNSNSLSDSEIEEKIILKHYLDNSFYLLNGNLYQYLEYSLLKIIEFAFVKYKHLNNLFSLSLSVKSLFKLFFNDQFELSGYYPFDIFNENWGFRAYVKSEDVMNILAKIGIKEFNASYLLGNAGWDIYDLSKETLDTVIIPRLFYNLALNKFQSSKELDSTFFNINNYRIGLG